jgi:hypothetical protein
VVEFGGRAWIDAGMVSAANARIADGYARILVIAPMPKGHAGIPSAAQDTETMRRKARIELIVPDQQSIDAIGPQPVQPGPPRSRCRPAGNRACKQPPGSITSGASLPVPAAVFGRRSLPRLSRGNMKPHFVAHMYLA